ncbi:MAG: prepilin peptidase [Catonella sp.]|uniref:prepilin peptidase n=1 Tax=Catonella sp. TaxID=2382125 RepID=UPI003F9F4B4C
MDLNVVTICINILFILSLIMLSVIDWITYEIPPRINFFIFLIGVLKIVTDFTNLVDYVLGFFSISLLLILVYLVTKGRAIGGGDIKLMAVSGLFLGFGKVVLAFFLGCVFASIIHSIRMKLNKSENILALGPYLSAGILVSLFWGKDIIEWYLQCGS